MLVNVIIKKIYFVVYLVKPGNVVKFLEKKNRTFFLYTRFATKINMVYSAVHSLYSILFCTRLYVCTLCVGLFVSTTLFFVFSKNNRRNIHKTAVYAVCCLCTGVLLTFTIKANKVLRHEFLVLKRFEAFFFIFITKKIYKKRLKKKSYDFNVCMCT